MLKLWCVRDEAPACVMCFLEGQHKGHDYERREAVEARQREAELARVEAALGKIDAAVKLVEMIEADQQKSASEARAAKKRYLGRLFEVVMLREKALGDKINEWERSRADQVSRRRAVLGWARRRLEDERTAIEQGSAGHGSKQSTGTAEVCQKANAMAAEVEAERLCTGRISFASGGANIAQGGGTASVDLVGAILHAGHLHIYTTDTKVRLSSLLVCKAKTWWLVIFASFSGQRGDQQRARGAGQPTRRPPNGGEGRSPGTQQCCCGLLAPCH